MPRSQLAEIDRDPWLLRDGGNYQLVERHERPDVLEARRLLSDEAATLRSQGYTWHGATAEVRIRHEDAVILATGATRDEFGHIASGAITTRQLTRLVRSEWSLVAADAEDTRSDAKRVQLRAYDGLLAALHAQLVRLQADPEGRDVAPTVSEIRKVLKERALLQGLGKDAQSAEAIVEAAMASLADRVSRQGGRVRSRSRAAGRTIEAGTGKDSGR
jgi:hypothetical protein